MAIGGGLAGHRLICLFGLKVDRRAFAVAAGFEVVADFLPFKQAPHAGPLDRRHVDKYVTAAVVRLDEPVALLPVEPFYRSGSHSSSLPFLAANLCGFAQISQVAPASAAVWSATSRMLSAIGGVV
jgi:hypothetical protein